jgi:glyoxylase-like metal-dependent hydrolase (beta-lactamase superfamily II)
MKRSRDFALRKKSDVTMRIHHISCGTDCPVGGRLFDGASSGVFGRLICHCLLIETSAGLVLVDTGYGLSDVARPHPRMSRVWRAMLNIRLREEETAIRQIQSMGFSPADVRHIVLTHLDFDHAGGLEDFCNATVHVMADEMDAAVRRSGYVARQRYRPMQMDGVRKWERYEAAGERWFGFDSVRDLKGLPPEILMVPLRGHSEGHAGIAVRTGDTWLLHAGDAYFFRHEVRHAKRACTLGLRAYQTLMETDRRARMRNQARLRRLSLERANEIRMICAHDVVEFKACHGSSAPGVHQNAKGTLSAGAS